MTQRNERCLSEPFAHNHCAVGNRECRLKSALARELDLNVELGASRITEALLVSLELGPFRLATFSSLAFELFEALF